MSTAEDFDNLTGGTSHQPKPEVCGCKLTMTENFADQIWCEKHTKQQDKKLYKPSPASTEEWEKKVEDIFNLESGDAPYWLTAQRRIKELFRSHDQQLRQRIVADFKTMIDFPIAKELCAYCGDSVDFEDNCVPQDGEKHISIYDFLITNLK